METEGTAVMSVPVVFYWMHLPPLCVDCRCILNEYNLYFIDPGKLFIMCRSISIGSKGIKCASGFIRIDK